MHPRSHTPLFRGDNHKTPPSPSTQSLPKYNPRIYHQSPHNPRTIQPTMAPKLLTLIRHAEAYHNADRNPHLSDPYLTPLGEEQCRSLFTRFPPEPTIDLLVSSPLKRTLQTTLLGFAPQAEAGLTIEVLPELQESSLLPCDTGSARDVLEKDPLFKNLDFRRLPPDWDSKTGKWAPDPAALRERAKVARNWLKSRDENHIVAILHGGFLQYLTGGWTSDGHFSGTCWSNTEFRSYTFVDEGDENAPLVETEESRARRMERPF